MTKRNGYFYFPYPVHITNAYLHCYTKHASNLDHISEKQCK